MIIVSLSEAKAHLSEYGRLCRREPVVVTVHGQPAFQLVPLEESEDLIDRLLEHHPRFASLLKYRLKERSLTATDAAKRL